MINNKIAVQQQQKKDENSNAPFVMPTVTDSLGIIIFSNDSNYPVGLKIYYGSKRERLRMNGMDLEIMELDNVYAVVEEYPLEDCDVPF